MHGVLLNYATDCAGEIKRSSVKVKAYEEDIILTNSAKSDIIKSEEVRGLEQAKKRDNKIYINNIAIENVDYVRPDDFTVEQAKAMQMFVKEQSR